MKRKELKQNMAFEALIILLMLALLTFICRLWPILLVVILGIFIASLHLLFLSFKKTVIIETEIPSPTKSPLLIPTEQNVIDLAYVVIVMRITDLVLRDYPNARWVWENPNVQRAIETEESVYIMLNRAGGYRKAKVIIKNFQVIGIEYCTSAVKIRNSEQESDVKEAVDIVSNDTEKMTRKQDDEQPENYELLAFEWVESHILELNERCNEAIAENECSLTISAEELPKQNCWSDICKELVRMGIQNAICTNEGIQIKFTH